MPARDPSATFARIADLLGAEVPPDTAFTFWIGRSRFYLGSFDDILRLWDEYAKGWKWYKFIGEWSAYKGNSKIDVSVPDTNHPAADFAALLAEVLDAGRSKP